MPSSLPVAIKESSSQRSACGPGRFLVSLESFVTALIAGLMPVAYCLAILAFACLAGWHVHRTVMVINFGSTFGVKDGMFILAVVAEVAATVLLLRQLLTPKGPITVRMELLQGDQPELFE